MSEPSQPVHDADAVPRADANHPADHSGLSRAGTRDPTGGDPIPVGDPLPVEVRRLDPDLPLPSYSRPGDAGLDLYAAAGVRLEPGARTLIPTGLAVAIPQGYVGLVHPRSGLAARHGLTIVNAPGTIDAGYRGEILVNLLNTDATAPVSIHRGDRIAQLLIQPVCTARLVEVANLPESERGVGGHGHSGGFGTALTLADGGADGATPRAAAGAVTESHRDTTSASHRDNASRRGGDSVGGGGADRQV